ncbi:UHRF1-binding protein 1-like [Linum perenne]
MEAILARALEYTLKYWLKSFSRDQLKLQGRTVQLSNLDINGDALHASMGLPPAINVTKAKVGKFEIILPYVSNVQTEPIVVQIDKLDLVFKENRDWGASNTSQGSSSSSSTNKGSGYGFADKVADGMTIKVATVNLLLETQGSARRGGEAAWAPPMASITIRNLILYTTNENWEVVNLKDARDFSNDKPFIYVFKKLEWGSLSIDLLPHPDMFTEANIERYQEGKDQRDDDGAKRVFFGGERFLEGISGEAYITLQRTNQNSPLGLEVQLHVTEAVCPALSEPGLRALLRFFTGLYVCLNRGDVDLKAQQSSSEAAGRSLVSIVVDHIFLCIKDAEFQLELLMQSLFFSRATVSDGELAKTLTKVMIGGLFLRDTFCRPPCTLVQPSMLAAAESVAQIPTFAMNFCPPIYPLGDHQWQLSVNYPLISLHSLQVQPSPVPPSFACQTHIVCQPLTIHLQEDSCLRISSFLADGIVVNPGDVLPEISVNSMEFSLKELDFTVPLGLSDSSPLEKDRNLGFQRAFTEARLHIENLFFSESPSLKLRLLKLEKDPACFCLWPGQPIDASQKKWTVGASCLSLFLDTSASSSELSDSRVPASELWRCVELKDASVEVAMVSPDGSPLTNIPPPGGIVRIGVACQQYISNTSVEQLFFVLDLYSYFGTLSERIASLGKRGKLKSGPSESSGDRLMDKVPADTAVSLRVNKLQLTFLESSVIQVQGKPLVQFIGEDLFIKVTHRTLGGAVAVSSVLQWQTVEIDCVETEDGLMLRTGDNVHLLSEDGYPDLRAVLWVHKDMLKSNGNGYAIPFLEVIMEHMIPFSEEDRECHSLSLSVCVYGLRLGGGMNYAETLLHRFGIIGPDGGPGESLSKALKNLSKGPLSKIFKASPLIAEDVGEADASSGYGNDSGILHLGMPDDVDVSLEFKNWLFALEGEQEMADDSSIFNHGTTVGREQRSWHTTFRSLLVKAKSYLKDELNGKGNSPGRKHPVDLITVGVDGLQILKPNVQKQTAVSENGIKEVVQPSGGLDVEVRLVLPEENVDDEYEMDKWEVENFKFSVKQPIQAVVTKDELQHLAFLCKSEVDAMGRITASVLRLLKLENSIGLAAIDQLSNLGSEGFDKILTPERLSRVGSPHSFANIPPFSLSNGIEERKAESTVSSLEEAVADSESKCAAIMANLSNPESALQNLTDVIQVCQNLESIKSLLTQLRTQI